MGGGDVKSIPPTGGEGDVPEGVQFETQCRSWGRVTALCPQTRLQLSFSPVDLQSWL